MSRPEFFFVVEIFKIETFSRDFVESRFLSRLSRRIEIVKICQEALRFVKICQDTLRFVKKSWHYWVWKWWKVLTNWEILTRKCKNPCTSRLTLRHTVKKCQNLINFLISIQNFWSGHWCRDEIEKSQLSRCTFWKWQDFLDCWDRDSWSRHDPDTIETNQDPQA